MGILMGDEHEKGIIELMGDLGRKVRETDRMLDNRCIDCGGHGALILRCPRCEAIYQAEQRLYRSAP